MDRDWAGLPPEFVESISKRISIYADYLRFRSVCRKWRLAVPKTPLGFPPQCPLLMLSHSTFADFSTTKTHNLAINLPPSRIYGSSHGWVVTLNKTPQFRLLNPFTHASISLPDLDIFDIIQQLSLKNPRALRYFLIHRIPFHITKVVLSSSPSQNDNFGAFALVSERLLAFCRKGFDSWNLVCGELYPWKDIVHRKENGLFYAVSKGGTIAVCDVESSSLPRVQFFQTVVPGQFSGDIHYAMFSGDDLLLVARALNQNAGGEPNSVWTTAGFEVFKMDWGGSKWDKIETLGDKVLFVGVNSSLSFSASDFGGCFEADCIYFTGLCDALDHEDTCGKRDMGKFRLRDKRIESFPCQFGSSLPIWLTPNPY